MPGVLQAILISELIKHHQASIYDRAPPGIAIRPCTDSVCTSTPHIMYSIPMWGAGPSPAIVARVTGLCSYSIADYVAGRPRLRLPARAGNSQMA